MSIRPLYEIAEDLIRMSSDEDERHYYAEAFTPLFEELSNATVIARFTEETLVDLCWACRQVQGEGFVPKMSMSYSHFLKTLDRAQRFIDKYNILR